MIELESNDKHIPGPWEVRKNEPWIIQKAWGDMKSVVHTNYPLKLSETMQANIELMAIAPELLYMLRKLIVCLENDDLDKIFINKEIENSKKLIKKLNNETKFK